MAGERVLKLYADIGRYAKLRRLQRFYDSLVTDDVEFALPHIYQVTSVHELLAVVERRIEGKPLSDLIGGLGADRARTARRVYLDTARTLQKIGLASEVTQYVLFDDSGTSSTKNQGWSKFIFTLAEVKLAGRRRTLEMDVVDLSAKHARLSEIFSACAYDGPLKLVHGDFFPGNLLMHGVDRAAGVIDFGSFTMFGDPLYDLALACLFFDMYGQDSRLIRDEMIDMALVGLGADERIRFHAYAMAYALMSCDRYGPAESLQEDGHYRWATGILNDAALWRQL